MRELNWDMSGSANGLALVSQRNTRPLFDPQAIIALYLVDVFAATVCIISPAECGGELIDGGRDHWTNHLHTAASECSHLWQH